jgi:phosphoserine phosphatase
MTPRDGPQPVPGATPATPHDAPPAAALAAIRAFDGPLLVDLDETLYLRNSTEDFIDSARPAIAALALMKLLDWTRPWRWTGGEATRDAWRVRSVLLLMPWTLRRWRQRIPELVEQFGNRPLIAALRAHVSRPIIVTRGFRPVVTPLVAAFALGEAGIVALRPEHFADRLRGKLQHALDQLGEDTVRRALAVTDSIDDLPLLEACARPLCTRWPEARTRAAHADIYIPGRYISRVKHPGERYIVRGILQEDFAFWLLASISLATAPVAHVAGLLFLLLSFWAIYECGYVDNDRVGALHEAQPRLSAAFHLAPVPTPRWDPWVWALVSGAIAILLLHGPADATAMDFVVWTGVLLASHGWFLLYNRFDKPTRVWLYPGLQFARTAAFVTLAPVVAIGAAALTAQVLAKWVPYYVYRFGGRDWPEAPLSLTRLLFFVVLGWMLALTEGLSSVLTWSAAALLGWNLWRAHADLRAVVARARRIDRPQADAP